MRYLLLTLAVILLSLALRAQVSFGPAVALNISKQQVKGDYEELKLTSQTGFQAGVFVNYKRHKKIGLHTELAYSPEGTGNDMSWYVSEDELERFIGTYKFNYLRLLILPQYYFTEELYIEAGPGLGYLSGGKIIPERGNVYKYKKGDYLSFDAGLSLGMGYSLSKVVPGLTAGFRYYHGLLEVENEGANYYNTQKRSAKNRSFSLHVRYGLLFGKK